MLSDLATHYLIADPIAVVDYFSLSTRREFVHQTVLFCLPESDCAQPDSDSSSEGVTDSVATCCLQGGENSSVGVGSNSRGASTEILGGSGDLLSGPGDEEEGVAPLNAGGDEVVDGLTPIQHSKVVMRQKRRNSDRPWSVSSLSQLQKAVNRSSVTIGGSEASGSNNQLFANFSISESALNTLSPGRTATPKAHIKSSESRSSLKRRKYRMKRRSFVSFLRIFYFTLILM